MLVINTNNHPVPVEIDTPKGPDVVHVASKGRVTLPEGVKVNTNWLASNGAGIVVNAPVVAPTIPLKVEPQAKSSDTKSTKGS